MVQEDRYCLDILTQVAAAQTALENVALEILNDHVKALRGRSDGSA